MAKNKLKYLIQASILNNITEPMQNTPYERTFNLINQHFQDKRFMTYPEFIGYVFSGLSGKCKVEFENKVKGGKE